MLGTFRRRSREDPVRRLSLIVALLTMLLSGCVGLFGGVLYPSITLDKSVTDDLPVHAAFMFEGAPVTFDLTVDGSLYAGAVAAPKTVTRFGDEDTADWIGDYYAAFVNEEHQLPFIDNLLDRLRTVRDERGLDADRYAELLTVYVQSIPYRTDPVDLQPKFPVETFVDNAGDCDDKALLLASLLSREGYDVAILLFEPEKHVSLGIRSAEIPYLETGYAFTETTTQAFIGMVPDEFADGVTLESTPRVLRINSGTLAYAAGAQVRAILDKRASAVALAAELEPQLDVADTDLNALETRVNAQRAELQALRDSGRIAEYNARVDDFNALVAGFNAAVADRNALAARLTAAANVERAVLQGLTDRPGTYARVPGMPL